MEIRSVSAVKRIKMTQNNDMIYTNLSIFSNSASINGPIALHCSEKNNV